MSKLRDKLVEIKAGLDGLANALDGKCKSKIGSRSGDDESHQRSPDGFCNSECERDNVLPLVSWHDLADAFTKVQAENPVVRRFKICIIRIPNTSSPLEAHFKIDQIFLDEKGGFIYGDALRKTVVARSWMAVKLDDKLSSLIGESNKKEFSL